MRLSTMPAVAIVSGTTDLAERERAAPLLAFVVPRHR
jgi:hypothetical protein